jgi:hypothetical protein
MKPCRLIGTVLLLSLLSLQGLAKSQPAASSACTGPNGSRFNLEPRPNAVVQAAQSVAFLSNGASQDIDLVLATATDMRAIAGVADDAFYVQRSSSNCAPDLEGELPILSNSFDPAFLPNGTPIAVADPARNAFFIADIRFGDLTDDNGVGILRTTAAALLDTTACPSGTQFNGSAGCFTAGSVFNITELNTFLSSPQIAVDPRTEGTGAGDVYTVVTQDDAISGVISISLMACTNADLNCSNPVLFTEKGKSVDYAFVQVRPDGGITVSYRSTTFPGINPEKIMFVRCTPNGAPAAPTCGTPVLVTTEKMPNFDSSVGVDPIFDAPYPVHTNRLESDGKTVTTFLVYDRCHVPVINFNVAVDFCPKTDAVITSSSDGGDTWSPVSLVTTSPGQQFFVTIATDASTGTVNLAYYSTENDPNGEHAQVFLAQIAPGTTTVGSPQLLTSAFADPEAISPIPVQFEPTGLGDRIGLAAAGTGTSGQSHAYVGFTWNSVFGTYGGVSSADTNNHLSAFQY